MDVIMRGRFGVLILTSLHISLTCAAYCTVSYPCTKYCTTSVQYTTSCGLFGWGRCTRYRSVSDTCSSTCYRQECCTGYQGPSCQTPVCYGSTVCPNGGTCERPDICSCATGFVGDRCTDLDECTYYNGGCHHYCRNTYGSFSCSCRVGYRLSSDGRSCIDIDECSIGTAGCAQICSNSLGSFTCSCRPGYISDGISCQDIDECATEAAGCSQLCENLPGSYECSCNENYQLEADRKTCTEINDCTNNPCNNGATCEDHVGRFTCICASGYTGQTCEDDIDDCTSDPCQNGGTCVDHVARFTCICPRGYTGPTCGNDIDECLFINGGCQHLCTNTLGSFTCSCYNGSTLVGHGFSCSQGETPNTEVSGRYKMARKLLPRGCHQIVLTSCPDGKDIEVRLSSTSSWFQSLNNTDTFFSSGVIFAEVKNTSQPVSIDGVTIVFSGPQFFISHGVALLTPADGIPIGTTRTEDCISLNLTPADVNNFIQDNFFLNTIFDKIIAVLPDFITLSGVDSSLLDVDNMRTDFVYGRNMSDMAWCDGAPVIEEHLYSVFRFNTNFKLSMYGNMVNVPEPLTEKQFCLIVDICHDYGGTVFLMIPEGSRQLLQDFNFFRKLKDNQKLSILPHGIGISLVKGINAESFTTSAELWNGDQFFSFPTFARSDVWIRGNINYDTEVFESTAVTDAFISVPNPNQILTGIFVEEWNVMAHSGASHLLLKFSLFNKDYAIPILDAQTIDIYMSFGGLEERKWCGDWASNDIANPPGAFFTSKIVVNPFANVPILGDWVIKGSTQLHAYFTTDASHGLSSNKRIDIMDDIIQLNLTLSSLETFLEDLQSTTLSNLNVSSVIINDFKVVVTETKTLLSLNTEELAQGKVWNLHSVLPHLWGQSVKMKAFLHTFSDAVEFIVSRSKDEISNFLKEKVQKIEDSINTVISKLSDQVTTAVGDYSSFGGKFAKLELIIFGLNFGELDVELSISNDIVARCSRFEAVYKLLEGQRAVRMLARHSKAVKYGKFLSGRKGYGIGAAFGMASDDVIFQLQAYITILGFSRTADVFLSRKGFNVYLEANIWDIFLAQIDMSATLGDQWHALTFTLKGRFVAKAREKRQIQSQGASFQDSYLDALTQLANKLADEADKRINQAQGAITKAQTGLTKAQNWLEEKKTDVRKANDAFDLAVRELEGAKQKLEQAKGPFQDALNKLSDAQRKVENLCKIMDCEKICVPGIECKICHKKVWFANIPYPCCSWTSCMFSISDPICVAANLACRAIRALAFAALEAAKLFVRVPMLAFDVAKAAVSTAQFIVDKSRNVLVIAEDALEVAKGALETVKNIMEVAKITLESLKVAIRGAVKILELVLQNGLKALIDIRNCGFEVQLSTEDLPVFEVSCEVNAFQLGWKTIQMKIDFKNAFQTIWRAAKATLDAIVNELTNIQGRRKREISYPFSMALHRRLRQLRQAEEDISQTDVFENVIDIVNQTLGMNGNISGSYEGRTKWFEDKCKSANLVERFLLESFGALFEIANESKSSMELPANLSEPIRVLNFEGIMNDMTLERANISESYGSTVYGISRSDMDNALLYARTHFSEDPVVIELNKAKDSADKLINDKIQNVGRIPVIEYWVSAMRNGTLDYFDEDKCSGFEDCLFYAVTTLYGLYEDENDLPNITIIRDMITTLETDVLSLIQSNTTAVNETFARAEAVYKTIQSLTRLNVFCSQPPRFTSTFRNSTVFRGSTVRFECKTKADPPAFVRWFKNELLHSESREALVIANASVEDEGMYKCSAENLVASINSPEMFLTVVQPPGKTSLATSLYHTRIYGLLVALMVLLNFVITL